MATTDELLDDLMKITRSPKILSAKKGLLKQLTKALVGQ